MTAPVPPTPLPGDFGAGRPIEITPMPAVVNIEEIPGAVNGVPQQIIRMAIITPAGSAYAHMIIGQAEEWLKQAEDVVRQAKSGIAVPRPGGLIIPPGANGHPR